MKNSFSKQIIIYQGRSGEIEFRGDFERETIWGNINQIADVFGVQKAAISKHLKNIYKEKELQKKATFSILETVQTEGKREVRRNIEHYNLDVIISIGYRANSPRATHFRRWATKILRQYLIKGYAINEKRLLETKNKFHELQETVLFLQKQSKKELLKGQEAEILITE